jgi:hypothetical protein
MGTGVWQARVILSPPVDEETTDILEYLAGLFATSPEPLDLELEAFDDELAPRMKGLARIDMGEWALPTQVPCTVRFVGTEPLEYPE